MNPDFLVFTRFIRYLEEVARRGSIRQAAERLNVAPSAVDRQLLKVEQVLGLPLFERLPKGLRLTEAGRILVDGARRWQNDFGRVQSDIAELQALHRGHVVVAAAEGAATEFVPDTIATFSRRYPGITYSVVVEGSDAVRRLVLAGEAELGLAFSPTPSPDLRIDGRIDLKLGVVTPPKHPLTKRAAIKLSDCAPYPIILPDETISLRRVIDETVGRAGVRLRTAAVCNSMAVVKSLVLRGLGIGILTQINALAEVRLGQLSYVPIAGRGSGNKTGLCLLSSADRRLSVAAHHLQQTFQAALASLSRPARKNRRLFGTR